MPLSDLAATPSKDTLQFGIYRDGDNNLDEAQSAVIDQARDLSSEVNDIAFDVKDTTARDDEVADGGRLRTEQYNLANGQTQNARITRPQDMSKRKTLADFVEHTLDASEQHHAAATWLDLVDHGGGDGGAFQTNSSHGNVMCEDDIAGAIGDGIRAHAAAHPEDASRKIDGVVANACLMATLGMESALSHVGVREYAASPETMLAPGAPSTVAKDIVDNLHDPLAMARGIVHRTMDERYDFGDERFGPAAAFDVFDLDPTKIATMESAVKHLNQTIVAAAKDPQQKAQIRSDGRAIQGMTRSQEPGLPWHADRPAELLDKTLASDQNLNADVRNAAAAARAAIGATVLAHRESSDYVPFDDASYRDAAGPTTHFPISHKQIDPWAPTISETDTAFAAATDERQLDRALA